MYTSSIPTPAPTSRHARSRPTLYEYSNLDALYTYIVYKGQSFSVFFVLLLYL